MPPTRLDATGMRAYYINMVVIAETTTTSISPPSAFFARWADMVDLARMERGHRTGPLGRPLRNRTTGILKPKAGPKVKFVIESLVPDRGFIDGSLLVGARLTFHHLVEPLPDRGCTVRVPVTIQGPLAWLWKRILGKGLAASLEPDLARLVARAEAAA